MHFAEEHCFGCALALSDYGSLSLPKEREERLSYCS